MGRGHWEGKNVAIPSKYPLSLSVFLILLGTGIVVSEDSGNIPLDFGKNDW